MKKHMLSLAAVVIGLTAIALPPKDNKRTATETLKVNTSESTLKWHAKKVTGEHYGVVAFENGEILVEGNTLAGGTVTVNMTTLDATDLQGEYHDKLVGHLKSDDFFSTEKHKTATLKIKTATAIKGAKPGTNNYNIVADLTIKGITKEVKFPAMVVITKGKVIANADFNVDRTQYDIRYGSKTFFESIGDKAIDNDFNLKVRIIAAN